MYIVEVISQRTGQLAVDCFTVKRVIARGESEFFFLWHSAFLNYWISQTPGKPQDKWLNVGMLSETLYQ